MKIAFDAKRAFLNTTGLGNYSRILLNALMRDFPANDYLLFSPKVDEELRSEIIGTYQLKLPETQFNQAFHSYWRATGLVKEIAKSKAEVFHGLSNELPYFGNHFFANSCKKIVTIHDLIFLKHKEQYPFFDRSVYEIKTKYAAQKADCIIVPSIETKRDLMRFYNVQENKIEVVYQSCSPDFYQEKSELEKQQVIEKFQLPKKFILNVSSFHARKNQQELIKAFEKIKGKVEEKLVMVGNTGAMLPMIQSYLAEKKLENDVFILGQVSNKELPAVYQLSSVFVYPSMLEGFGIPILEALFSKIPVVTSAGGCFEEVGGANSSYINPNSADDIADKVLFILNNSKQKEGMITKGIIHAQTMTDKHFAKATMEIYQR